MPSLYQLLPPVAERDARFWVGSVEYDPKRIGYRAEKLAGTTLLDTRMPGNSNCGHEFRDPSEPPAEHCLDPVMDACAGWRGWGRG